MSFRIRLTHPAAPLAAAPSHARRGNSRCGAGLVRNLLRGMVCAVLTVQMLTGCARSTPQEPVQWDLSPEAQRTYATLLLDQSIRGDDKEGVLEAVKLLLTLENRPQPFIDAAAWLMLNRETSEARSLLEQAVKRVPGDLGLHLLLAETWLEQGDNEQALKILKEYRKQRPDSELVQQELGILYVKTGHFKDADKVFSALPQRLRTSLSAMPTRRPSWASNSPIGPSSSSGSPYRKARNSSTRGSSWPACWKRTGNSPKRTKSITA